MRSPRYILSSAFLLFLTGCATSGFLSEFNLISPQEELKLGEELSQNINKEYKVVKDEFVVNYVRSVGQRLAAVSQTANNPYQFNVLVDKNVNAFATPGWRMYVLTGLVGFADNEAEMAAVLAHELGHAEKRHPTQQLSRVMGTQMLMSIILGKNNEGATAQVVNLLAQGGISAYSRNAEREADTIAVNLLNRAGYDPGALVSFFEKLIELEQKQGASSGIALFSSHPDTAERIASAKNLIASFGTQRQTGVNLSGDFNELKKRVKTLE